MVLLTIMHLNNPQCLVIVQNCISLSVLWNNLWHYFLRIDNQALCIIKKLSIVSLNSFFAIYFLYITFDNCIFKGPRENRLSGIKSPNLQPERVTNTSRLTDITLIPSDYDELEVRLHQPRQSRYKTNESKLMYTLITVEHILFHKNTMFPMWFDPGTSHIAYQYSTNWAKGDLH